jgi:hypothetical protein
MVDLSIADAALAYAQSGLHVLPLQAGRKEPLKGSRGYLDATTDPEIINDIWSSDPTLNLGISPEPSGIFVIDVDPRNGGAESWNRLAKEFGIEDAKPAVYTGGGGSHYYFRLSGDVSIASRNNAFGLDYPGIDVKSKGGYVVAPPSLHPNGEQYRTSHSFPPVGPLIAPPALIERLLNPPANRASQTEFVYQGARNAFLASHAGRLRNEGLDLREMTEALQALNIKKCSPPLLEKEVGKIAKSIHNMPAHRNGCDGTLTIRQLSEIEPKPVKWLWKNRAALGKITVFAGDPGVGKSYASIAIASAVTRGLPLPREVGPKLPGDVMIVSYEDDAEDTIRPQADLSGADTARLHLLEGPRDENGNISLFSLAHVPRLEEELKRRPDVRLLIIDPVGALLGATDSHRDSNTRFALAPLAALGKRFGIAIFLIMHLNKAEQMKVLYRVGGSIGFVGVARSVLMFGIDEATKKRACIPIKTNLTALAEVIEYTIDDSGFHWLGVGSELTAEKLFAVKQQYQPRSNQNEAVEEFLLNRLSEGRVPSKEVYAEAAQLGISSARVTKARDRIGAVPQKDGLEGGWFLSLPGPDTSE